MKHFATISDPLSAIGFRISRLTAARELLTASAF
jgi:hypothetical protein